jgi:hypothetical protein
MCLLAVSGRRKFGGQWDWTSETFGAARQALQQAVALDPTNSQARRELAWLGLIGWIFRVDATPVAPQDIIADATKGVQLDPDDARARMVAAPIGRWPLICSGEVLQLPQHLPRACRAGT